MNLWTMDPYPPQRFELEVRAYLEFLYRLGGGTIKSFQSTVQEKVSGAEGEYAIDVTARFEFLGFEFIVLVECKRHSQPIKREVVQVLRDKMESVGAHKGIIFSTAPFQQGAIEYAAAHGIGLVECQPPDQTHFILPRTANPPLPQGAEVFLTRWSAVDENGRHPAMSPEAVKVVMGTPKKTGT